MSPKEERLTNDCRQAKEALGDMHVTWIDFPLIKAKSDVPQEGDHDGTR